jgi:hypothetical protein
MISIDQLISRIEKLAGDDEKLKSSTIKDVVQETAFFVGLMAEPKKNDELHDKTLTVHLQLGARYAELEKRFGDDKEKKDWIAVFHLKKVMLIAQALKSVIDENDASIKMQPELQTDKPPKEMELRLDDTGLTVDGKYYELKANALAMWRLFFQNKGICLHQADFPGFETRKAIQTMPPAVKKLIQRGRPHQGYLVPRLRK